MDENVVIDKFLAGFPARTVRKEREDNPLVNGVIAAITANSGKAMRRAAGRPSWWSFLKMFFAGMCRKLKTVIMNA